MAKQTVNIGTNANDGTGDPLRSAFDKLNDNFDEVYADSFVTTDRINADAVDGTKIADDAIDSEHYAAGSIDEEHLNASNSPTDNYILSYDSGSGGFTWVEQFDGDITSIVAGDGLTGTSLDTDDATLNVNVDDSTIEIDTDVVQVKDNGIDHDQLAGRYTEEVDISTYAGTVSFDCSTGTVFKLGADLSGTYTIDLSNYKKGQVITIYPLTGNQTLNLDAQGTSTNTFNKIGGVDYEDDGTSDNILQIECVDDSSTDPVFFYSLATYASDSSDI